MTNTKWQEHTIKEIKNKERKVRKEKEEELKERNFIEGIENQIERTGQACLGY